MWSTGEGKGDPFQYCCKNPMNSMKGHKYKTSEYELPRSKGVQYATGEEQRAITNCSRKNEVAEPKWKEYLVVDMFGGESKV